MFTWACDCVQEGMSFNHFATFESSNKERDRRAKYRFPMQRELRYRLFQKGARQKSGAGQTIDIGSGGVLFEPDTELHPGQFIELAISWPVLLEDSCPMQLVIF